MWKLCSLLCRLARAYISRLDHLHQRDRADRAHSRLFRDDRTLPIADITEQLEDSAERELPKLAECDECAGLDVEELVVHGEAASETFAWRRNVTPI